MNPDGLLSPDVTIFAITPAMNPMIIVQMMPKVAIAQIAKLIGWELESGAGPSEEALATGPILGEAGATNEIAERLFAEAHRKRPNNRMIEAYAFILE